MLDYQGSFYLVCCGVVSFCGDCLCFGLMSLGGALVVQELFSLLESVFCEEELTEAISTATGPKKDCLCFIEVIVHKDDTSKELLEWSSKVSVANSRPPNPQ